MFWRRRTPATQRWWASSSCPKWPGLRGFSGRGQPSTRIFLFSANKGLALMVTTGFFLFPFFYLRNPQFSLLNRFHNHHKSRRGTWFTEISMPKKTQGGPFKTVPKSWHPFMICNFHYRGEDVIPPDVPFRTYRPGWDPLALHRTHTHTSSSLIIGR